MADDLKYGNCGLRTWTGDNMGYEYGAIGNDLYGACARSSDDDYYYNYQAAVQDQSAYNGVDYQPSEPRQGICPAGWYLPTAFGSTDSIKALAEKIEVSNGRAELLEFLRPGGNWKNRGYTGYWTGEGRYSWKGELAVWATSGGHSTDATYRTYNTFYIASPDSEYVFSQGNIGRSWGILVRCFKQ